MKIFNNKSIYNNNWRPAFFSILIYHNAILYYVPTCTCVFLPFGQIYCKPYETDLNVTVAWIHIIHLPTLFHQQPYCGRGHVHRRYSVLNKTHYRTVSGKEKKNRWSKKLFRTKLNSMITDELNFKYSVAYNTVVPNK